MRDNTDRSRFLTTKIHPQAAVHIESRTPRIESNKSSVYLL